MKTKLLLTGAGICCSLLILSSCYSSVSCDCGNGTDTSNLDSTGFDQQLATELEADDYGMKQYVLAFLKLGPTRNQPDSVVNALQRAHMDNIGKLAEQRKLIVSGPFLDEGDLRGIYIFDVRTVEEAKLLTETDPAIKAGRLVMELHPWYGSAALIKSAEIHKTIAKKKI